MLWQYRAIQAVPSACSRSATGRQCGTAIEDTNIIETEEPALKHILAEPIFAVDPPRKIGC